MSRIQNFRLIVLLLLMCATSVGGVLFFQHELYFCFVFTILLGIILLIVATQWQSHTVHMITRMIEGINHTDFSINFSLQHKTKAEQRLASDMNLVLSKIRMRISDREERCQYYETLLSTVDTCMLVIDLSGKIHWMNHASTRELGTHVSRSINDLSTWNPDLPSLLLSLKPGDIKAVKVTDGDRSRELAVSVTEYSSKGTDLRLINIRNIGSVLEANEMEAWQKLIRVLTHEIMNSIAPIISLSDTLSERASTNGFNEKDFSIMQQAMHTIHRRSKGLLTFVENYRKLSRIAPPQRTPVSVGELLDDMKKLYPTDKVHYTYNTDCPELSIMIDRPQIEQTLINLIKNATEACCEKELAAIVIQCSHDRQRQQIVLSVSDNGCGILPEVQDKIFVPFFSTKQNGSGIGLNLCKQIVRLHGGHLAVSSTPGIGTTFTMHLPIH